MIPTRPGFYWAREVIESTPVFETNYQVVEVSRKDNGDYEVWCAGWEIALKVEDFTHWVGPLTPPNKDGAP